MNEFLNDWLNQSINESNAWDRVNKWMNDG